MDRKVRYSVPLIILAGLSGEVFATTPVSADSTEVTLGEVIVTARESRRPTSASLIDTTAMRHLQPSSFADLLSLLPGGVTKDPDMGSFNRISLRQAQGVGDNDDYATSALGTSFVVDGVPVITTMSMTATPDGDHSGRTGVGRGVDMRAISTDDVESVEVVRGIPSVEHGELTSGLINIRRKNSARRFEARFKADTQSRLFYAGKGLALRGERWIVNVSAAYLDSKIDPRNSRENFKRVNASLRSLRRWAPGGGSLEWSSSLNYSATFERDDEDPDLTVNNTIDSYRNYVNTFSFNNTLSFRPLSPSLSFSLVSGITYSSECLEQRKHVASSRVMPLPVSLTPGSNYVGFLPMLYLADYRVDGKPFSSYLKASARGRVDAGDVSFDFKEGAEWNVSKNFGDGPVYDLTRPLTAGNNSRPRRFSDVPAMQQLSAYIEDETKAYFGRHVLTLVAGLRATGLLNLDRRYALSGKIYLDPRVNAVWRGAPLSVGGKALTWELGGGFGWHTKMPVAAYLYPEKLYSDFEQLNYYHKEEAYRVMNVKTFVEDVTNYDLRAARNFKWELRVDLGFYGNRLSVTYFRENMTDGFRNTPTVHRYTYRRYDASGFDPYSAGRAPTIDELPFTEEVYQTTVGKTTNGSRSGKEGIEYTLQSRRLPKLRTRLTVSGAYFVTTNSSSQALWYKPSIVVNNRELQYLGLYDDVDGSQYRSFNTNFLLDTDIPTLRLNFSIGIQNLWFTSRRTLRRDGIPVHYMNPDGEILDYTADCMDDPYLGQLVRHYTESTFERQTVPSSTTVNFKATKSFWQNRVGLALYVNRLVAIEPDYKRYGITVRRYSSPYFGMELNLKL